MAGRAKKKQPAQPRSEKEERHLKSIPGGKTQKERPPSALDRVLSGRVPPGEIRPKKRRKGEVPPQELPKDIKPIANLLAAGRTLDKEIRFKVDYAKQQIEEFCTRDWLRRFAATNRKPSSIEYISDHSRFQFVMTSRTNLTDEKAEGLRTLGIPIDEHTQLRDVQINYDAIKRHGLQDKLREALNSLDVPEGVIEEIFVPKVELRDTFYDVLVEVVRQTLQSGEDLEEKLYTVVDILDPANQIRGAEAVGLDARQCFDLVHKTEIEAEEDIA